jgi:hypothetical protein
MKHRDVDKLAEALQKAYNRYLAVIMFEIKEKAYNTQM